MSFRKLKSRNDSLAPGCLKSHMECVRTVICHESVLGREVINLRTKLLEIKSMVFVMVPLILTERIAFIPTPDGGDFHVTVHVQQLCHGKGVKQSRWRPNPGCAICHFPRRQTP